MNVTRSVLVLSVVTLGLALGVADLSFAQERARARGGEQSQAAPRTGRAVPRNDGGPAAPSVRQAPQNRQMPQRAPQIDRRPQAPRSIALGRAVPDGNTPQRVAPQRVVPQRVAPQPRAVPRTGPRYTSPRETYGQRYDGRRDDDRRYDSRQYDNRPRYYSTPGYYARRYEGPRYVAPRYVYRPVRPIYPRYYSFRPRLHIGFGIYLGHAVGFPSWHNPYVPGVYAGFRPGGHYGGVSFDIYPNDADVWVDGEYMGRADDFSPYRFPLTLPAGRHSIYLDAPGYEPLSFDITVVPRQVIPYHGRLSY